MENNLDAKSFYQPDPIIRKGLELSLIHISSSIRLTKAETEDSVIDPEFCIMSDEKIIKLS